MGERLNVFVTVGTSRWPFERLLAAAEDLSAHHDVFVQSGAGHRPMRCPASAYLSEDEYGARLDDADVVVCHAGNVVRRVQRLGKAPIVVAREPGRGEVSNDHQIRFVEAETGVTPFVPSTGELDDLARQLAGHHDAEADLLARLAVPAPTSTEMARERLRMIREDHDECGPLYGDPTRRLPWAWSHLAGLDGPHLDLGCGYGELVDALATRTDRPVVGADPAAEKLRDAPVSRALFVNIGARDPLPFVDESFTSVSMLDSLEHVWDEAAVLAEVHRVLRPGGTLLVTVPGKYALSFLDPDNAKYRFPRLHRFVYSTAFGRERYRERFEDLGDGMQGDVAVERAWHSHYSADDLMELLGAAGFEPFSVDAANLFWILFEVPRLFLPERMTGWARAALRWDARWFHQANQFIAATKDAAPVRS